MNEDDDGPLEALLLQLRQLAASGGFSESEAIDLDKSRRILQVTQGDIETAAQLYWDDFLATQATRRPARNPPPPPDPPQAEPVVEEPPRPRVRRRLERDFNRQAPQRDPEEGRVGAGVARIIAQARETVRRLEGRQRHRERRESDGVNVAGLAARAAEAFFEAHRRDNEGNESVSVSDDESGGVWRMVGGIAARLESEGSPSGRDGSASPKRKRRKTEEHNTSTKTKSSANTDSDENAYLSDNDWLWESSTSRTSIPLCTPFDLLWGFPSSHKKSSATAGDSASGAGQAQEGIEGNVIADDDGDDESTGERPGIPRAWLGSGFTLSKDGTGLELESPNDDDIGFFAWQQQASGTVRNTPPPPFHCSSITAILSIVTGLLYTGAAYQTRTISCSTSRKPFVELTEVEKKRQFEQRLADALAALLYIAAKASRDRKDLALSTLKKSKDPTDKRKWQKLEAKLRLCPTCGWETDSNGDTRLPQGRESDRVLQIATSYTNLEDLRSYVLSNMRSFTSRGGCALFLETILRIHGKGAVMRMIKLSRRKANLPPSDKCLIDCKCEDRNKSLEIPPQQLKQRSKTRELMEAVPDGHMCLSVELISLLLTGQVHSSWKGWSTRSLGLGILSDKSGKIGKGLTRPEKPVWVLCGPKSYSVLWMNGGYENPEIFARADQPGSVVELTHFCCWPGQRHKTTLRLAPDRSVWKPPTMGAPRTEPELQTSSSIERFFARNRTVIPVSEGDLKSSDLVSSDLLVEEEELEQVVANPDDQKFYKGKFRMWRYHIEPVDKDTKPSGDIWVPFHRLDDRQKHLVETKLGPRISAVLWTRWPRAIVDGFSPEMPEPLV